MSCTLPNAECVHVAAAHCQELAGGQWLAGSHHQSATHSWDLGRQGPRCATSKQALSEYCACLCHLPLLMGPLYSAESEIDLCLQASHFRQS